VTKFRYLGVALSLLVADPDDQLEYNLVYQNPKANLARTTNSLSKP
jgi:hypothetical protein